MHFDLAHTIITILLMFATLMILRKAGIEKESGRWSWKIFGALFVVLFLFNLIWPNPA
jgi:hypothetical protein